MSTIAAGLTSTNALVSTGDTSGKLVFQTNGTTTAMTIDTSQNVGIGTNSPSTYGQFVVAGNSTGNLYQGNFANLNTGSNTTKTVSSAFVLADTVGTGKRVASILAYPDSANVLTGGMTFNVRKTDTDISEAMRIDSSGNLLVGTTTNPGIGKIAAYSNVAATECVSLQNAASSGTRYLMYFIGNAGSVGSITHNGTNTTYATSSDYRLKDNINPMTGALNVISQLKPVTYKWKTDGSDGQGFIAHELQEVVPDCVTGEKDAVDAEGKPVYQGIDTSFLVATLTKAIQEQQAIINELKSRIETLENK